MDKLNTLKEDTSSVSVREKYISLTGEILKSSFPDRKPKAYILTFGCQQNEADSEKLMGQAISAGYEKTDDINCADLIIYNTCAVREHAELRALSRTGSLKALKAKNKNLIIGIYGCMVTQNHRMNDIKMKYPYVDFVAGTNMLHRLPEILCDVLTNRRRRYYVSDEPAQTVEGIPSKRCSDIKAYVSIMYGCNNFCTYCVVPYVRGRERSRKKEDILAEISSLVKNGYKEITLLGQNVNSYRDESTDFPALLSEICKIDGDFLVRFMTSHPKDASDELISVIANNPKIERHFHLPMQSGSTQILSRMNRKYSAENYLALAKKLKENVQGIKLSTDIIVGFPGETEEDFCQTLGLVEEIGFDAIFSFIYSPRIGTPAAEYDDLVTHEEKTERMARLLKLQADISAKQNAEYVGKTILALCESKEKNDSGTYCARTSSNKLVLFTYDGDIEKIYGKNISIEITRSTAAQLYGTVKNN